MASREGIPVNHLVVKLDKGVARKPIGPVGDGDGLSVEDEADGSLARVRPALGNPIVKLVQVVNSLRRLLYLALVLLALLRSHRILAIDGSLSLVISFSHTATERASLPILAIMAFVAFL